MRLGMLFYSPTLVLFICCIINKNSGDCYVQVSNLRVFLSKNFALKKLEVVNSFQGFSLANYAVLKSLMCLSNFNKFKRLFPLTVHPSA